MAASPRCVFRSSTFHFCLQVQTQGAKPGFICLLHDFLGPFLVMFRRMLGKGCNRLQPGTDRPPESFKHKVIKVLNYTPNPKPRSPNSRALQLYLSRALTQSKQYIRTHIPLRRESESEDTITLCTMKPQTLGLGGSPVAARKLTCRAFGRAAWRRRFSGRLRVFSLFSLWCAAFRRSVLLKASVQACGIASCTLQFRRQLWRSQCGGLPEGSKAHLRQGQVCMVGECAARVEILTTCCSRRAWILASCICHRPQS